MLIARSPDSLYGKIIQRYFGFGLACICVLLGSTVYAATAHTKLSVWLIPVACAVPLTLLWVGGFHLRRLLVAPEQILAQLAELAESPGVDRDKLIPVTDAEPAAAGWNHLLEHMYSGRLSEGLERKLSAALQTGRNGQMTDVLNSLSDGVAVTDGTGTISVANFAFHALVNVSLDQLASPTAVHEALNRLSGAAELPPELTVKRASRCRFEIHRSATLADGVLRVCCAPLMTEIGEADSFVWTVRDVTQSKLAEKMRSQFLETATHELRTPLTNIRAYAETLELSQDISVEEQKEFVNIIHAEATRLGRFVDELLNLSRMDAGAVTIFRHETDFERLLNEVIEHTQPQMESKQQTFHRQLPAKLPTLNIDKDKIAACLVNLLGNASKYTPNGGEINLVVEQSAKLISVRVEDTGFGIAEDELCSVFNRFYRSNDDRVREESGSGLGLAYTQEIVQLHGGHLTVESRLNEGSEFTLSLPV